jgi:hypothetical protein
MMLLVQKDTRGDVSAGSDQALLQRAGEGDDLCVHICSQGYDETIMFGNYVIRAGRVSGLSLPHLNHGDLSEPERLTREPPCTVEYIYDSACHNVIAKDMLDGAGAHLTCFAHNPAYRSYTWFTTRRYVEASFSDLSALIAAGDQFKLMLGFAGDLRMVLKPDIIYFPDRDRQYLIKSSAMLLPADFASDPERYAHSGRPFVENQAFCRAYVNIDSKGRLTIVHKLRYATHIGQDKPVREGVLSRAHEGPTLVTQVHCEQGILVPQA